MTILRDANHIINAILIILFTFIRFSALAVKGNFCIYRPLISCLHQAPHMLNLVLVFNTAFCLHSITFSIILVNRYLSYPDHNCFSTI